MGRVSRAWGARLLAGSDTGRKSRARKRGSHSMKPFGTFELMRVWAAVTGLVLVLGYFGEIALGMKPSELLPMLVTAIGGFELVLYAQDIWIKRKRHG
jgi:hypothetical protein